MAGIIFASKLKPLRGLAKPPYSVYYSSAPRLTKAPSISDSSDSILATVLRLGKAAFVSNFSVSFLSTSAIWIAIEKGFDVQSRLEKLHLPRPDRPCFNNHTEGHERDNTASFGDKKNRTAELATSKGGSLALALLINRGLFPLRLLLAAALIHPVAKLLARWSTMNNSKALVQVALLSITIHVEPLLMAIWMLWITRRYEYAKTPDLKEESASDGSAISLEIIGRLVLTKAMADFGKELEVDAVFPTSRGKGNGQGGIFEDPVNEPKNAMNNLKVDPKGAGEVLYRPFKPQAFGEIYARLYNDMVKKLLDGMERPVGRKGCSVAAPSGMPFDPLRESMDAFKEKVTAKTTAPVKVKTTLKKDI